MQPIAGIVERGLLERRTRYKDIRRGAVHLAPTLGLLDRIENIERVERDALFVLASILARLELSPRAVYKLAHCFASFAGPLPASRRATLPASATR